MGRSRAWELVYSGGGYKVWRHIGKLTDVNYFEVSKNGEAITTKHASIIKRRVGSGYNIASFAAVGSDGKLHHSVSAEDYLAGDWLGGERNMELGGAMYNNKDWDRYLSREETLAQLERHGLLDGVLGDPTVDIGTAVGLANKYHLGFCAGIGHTNVKAYLPKQHWENEPPYSSADWVDRYTIQAAVCHCLINCFETGLLNMPDALT